MFCCPARSYALSLLAALCEAVGVKGGEEDEVVRTVRRGTFVQNHRSPWSDVRWTESAKLCKYPRYVCVYVLRMLWDTVSMSVTQSRLFLPNTLSRRLSFLRHFRAPPFLPLSR